MTKTALDIASFEKGEYQTPSYLSDDKCKALMVTNREYIEEFLEPFGNVVTLEMLAKLYLEYLKVIPLTNISVELKHAA